MLISFHAYFINFISDSITFQYHFPNIRTVLSYVSLSTVRYLNAEALNKIFLSVVAPFGHYFQLNFTCEVGHVIKS